MPKFLNIMWGKGQGSFFPFMHMIIKVFQHHSLKSLSFCRWTTLTLLSKVIDSAPLLGWQKSKTLRIPNAAEERYGATGTFIYRLWECSLGTQLSVSYKAKCVLTVWSNSHVPWYLSKHLESSYPHKNLLTSFCSFIHNCQNLEASKTSFSRWMVK